MQLDFLRDGLLAALSTREGVLALLVGASLAAIAVRQWWPASEPSSPLHVVITGGSKGLGKALAKEFLARGDRVVICGRDGKDLEAAVRQLSSTSAAAVFGKQADVGKSGDVDALLAFALEKLDSRVDAWINNAGCGNGRMASLAETSPESIERIISTNLTGTLLCCRAAMRSPNGAVKAIFNMDGAGSAGFKTPRYATYGSSKACLPQLAKSLVVEGKSNGKAIAVHTLSPGMMITELLMGKSSDGCGVDPEKVKSARIFNILAETPDVVARWMVPKVRKTAAAGISASGSYHRYLTPMSAGLRFVKALLLPSSVRNRLVDEQTGELVDA